MPKSVTIVQSSKQPSAGSVPVRKSSSLKAKSTVQIQNDLGQGQEVQKPETLRKVVKDSKYYWARRRRRSRSRSSSRAPGKSRRLLKLPRETHKAVICGFDMPPKDEPTFETELKNLLCENFADLPRTYSLYSKYTYNASKGESSIFKLKWFWYKYDDWRPRLTIMMALVLISLASVNFSLTIWYFTAGEAHSFGYTEYHKAPKVCSNSSCQQVSDFILERLNFNGDPCHDFYDFVCGKETSHPNTNEHLKHLSFLYAPTFRVIEHDFRRSKLLGNLITSLQKSPVGQKALQFYKACLDSKRRDENSLADFSTILKTFGLDKLSNLRNLTRENLFARWFLNTQSTFFHQTEIELMGDPFVVKYLFEENGFLVDMPRRAPISNQYAQQSFNDTFVKAKRVLRIVHKLLDLDDGPELEAMARDVICVETSFYPSFMRRTTTETIWYGDGRTDPKKQKHCEDHQTEYRDAINSFDPDPAPTGDFNYTVMIKEIASVLSQQSGLNISDKHRCSNGAYINHVGEFFQNSTMRRVVRYLQWSLYRSLYTELTWEIYAEFSIYSPSYNGRRPTWEFSCIKSLYQFFPEITTQHFIQKNKEQPIKLQNEANLEYELLKHMLKVLQEMPLPSTITKCPRFTKYREKRLRDVITAQGWLNMSTFSEMSDQNWLLNHLEKVIPHTPGALVEKVSPSHLLNIFTLSNFSQWLFRQKFLQENSLDGESFRNSLTRFVYSFITATSSIPNCLLEPPYFGNGLFVLDLAGYGANKVYQRLLHFFIVLYDFNFPLLPRRYSFRPRGAMSWTLMEFYNHHIEKYSLVLKEVQYFANPEDVRAPFNGRDYLILQLELEVLLRVLEQHPELLQREKLNGPLQRFNSHQLFFIHLVRVNCRSYSREELKIVRQNLEGPTIYNVVLANTPQFADTWNCPANSRMRRSGDMNWRIKNLTRFKDETKG